MVAPFRCAARHLARCSLSASLLLVAVACGGGGGDGGGGGVVPTVSSLQPTDAATLAGTVGAALNAVRVRAVDAQGAAVRGATVTWTPSAGTVAPTASTTDADGVASTTWTLGTTAGTQTLRAAAGSGSATVTATAAPDRAATVTLTSDAPSAITPGAVVHFTAAVRDRYANTVASAVRWSTSNVDVASIDSTGALRASNPGAVTVIATADTATGRAAITIGASAGIALTRVPTDTLRPRADLAIEGTGFVPAAMSATLNGLPVTLSSVTTTRLVAAVPSQSVLPCVPPSLATLVIRRRTGSAVDSAVARIPLDPATPRTLQPGERVVADSLTGRQCTRLDAGGRYVISLYNADTVAPGGVAVQLRGTSASATTAILASRVRTPNAVNRGAARLPDTAVAAARAHAAHLDRERGRLTRLGTPVPALARARAALGVRPGGVRALAAPVVGDVITVNAMYYDCAAPTAIRARVAAVGTRGIVLEDVAASGAGTRDVVYRQLADEFDRVMFPIVTQYFGDPLALDTRFGGDGHVRILITPYVTDSVPNTVGFMTGCNFYAKSQLPSSNEAAVFYARPPNAIETTAEWQYNLRPTLIHETKHLAAYAERFARAGTGQPVLEETWLEEATARLSEELYARTFSGATWKGNATYAPTVGCEVTRCDTRPLGVYRHFAVLADYESRVDSLTPIGRISAFDGTFYGSGWMLVRWSADQFATDEPSFLRALTTEVTATGLANLARRTGRAASAMLPDWSLALAVDDRPSFTPSTPLLTIPSWNTRDVFRGLNAYNAFQFPRGFPLLVRSASFGVFVVDVPLLRSWTSAYVELSGALGTRQLLSLEGRGGGVPPAGVGMGIVRIE